MGVVVDQADLEVKVEATISRHTVENGFTVSPNQGIIGRWQLPTDREGRERDRSARKAGFSSPAFSFGRDGRYFVSFFSAVVSGLREVIQPEFALRDVGFQCWKLPCQCYSANGEQP